MPIPHYGTSMKKLFKIEINLLPMAYVINHFSLPPHKIHYPAIEQGHTENLTLSQLASPHGKNDNIYNRPARGKIQNKRSVDSGLKLAMKRFFPNKIQ